MADKLLAGTNGLDKKTILFLVDGICGNKLVNGILANKWKMAPFNNDWASSLFVCLFVCLFLMTWLLLTRFVPILF